MTDVFSKKEYMSEEFKEKFSEHLNKYIASLMQTKSLEPITQGYLIQFFIIGRSLFEKSYDLKDDQVKEFFISFWVITLQAAMNPEEFNALLEAMVKVSPNTIDTRIFEIINKTLQ